MQKYPINQHLIENLLSWVSTGEIAILEIKRPFVWSSFKLWINQYKLINNSE